MMLSKLLTLGVVLVVSLQVSITSAFDYDIAGAGSIALSDVETGIGSLKTIFTNDEIAVSLDGLEWEAKENATSTSGTIFYETFVDGTMVGSGNMTLDDVGRELPSSMDVGTVQVSSGGRHTIEVTIKVGESEASTDVEVESYAAGVAILPLVVILILAIWTHMVEISLYAGIFVGACIVQGGLNSGFKESIENYILNALADVGHGYVYLFTFFLAGVVAMMEKSGGMLGFTKMVAKYAKTPRTGQFATFVVGVFIFFDDYANTLLAGQSMRALMDSLCISREKLSFFVDATAAPIASISPVSSWVGFEAGLIQEELDKLLERFPEGITVSDSGFAVFLQSIKYRYYPIFMLLLIILLIATQRDFGPMLIAERKTEVYKRTDGGDASTSSGPDKAVEGLEDTVADPFASAMGEDNKPRDDQPLYTYNMVLPLLVLVFLIFYTLVQTGDDGSGEQSFMDKIESSDSYQALLWSTMATGLITLIFYLIQFVKEGSLTIPSLSGIMEAFSTPKEKDEDADKRTRSLMSVRESVEAFLVGMGRVFPASIVLTLAWASGSLMTDIGCDRLFANWIVGGIDPENLPTLSFLISLFMALATGTSWGTMSILFPLIMTPTYIASNGDEQIFVATVAGVLSGSVAGDHMSPISDTTVLSSLATECTLMGHVETQAPYVTVVVLISILFGTLPIGSSTWPNVVGYILGILVIVAFVFAVCKPVLAINGAWDPVTLLYAKITKAHGLEQLKLDTSKAANGESVEEPDAPDDNTEPHKEVVEAPEAAKEPEEESA